MKKNQLYISIYAFRHENLYFGHLFYNHRRIGFVIEILSGFHSTNADYEMMVYLYVQQNSIEIDEELTEVIAEYLFTTARAFYETAGNNTACTIQMIGRKILFDFDEYIVAIPVQDYEQIFERIFEQSPVYSDRALKLKLRP